MDLSNCITDIKYATNIIWGIKLAYLCFNDLFSNVFINYHEYANYAIEIICILDDEMKALCLSFNLVPI